MYKIVGITRLNYKRKETGEDVRGYRFECVNLEAEATEKRPIWGTPVETLYMRDETLCLAANKGLFTQLSAPDGLLDKVIEPQYNKFGRLQSIVFVD